MRMENVLALGPFGMMALGAAIIICGCFVGMASVGGGPRHSDDAMLHGIGCIMASFGAVVGLLGVLWRLTIAVENLLS